MTSSGGRIIGFHTKITYDPVVVVLPLLELLHRFFKKSIGCRRLLLISKHTDFSPLCISVQFTAPIRKYLFFFPILVLLISDLPGLKD